MRQSKVIAFVIAIGVAVTPLAATAQVVVAVLSSRAALRAKITRACKQEGIRVLSGKQVSKAMRGQHAPLSESDWARIGGQLGVDAFVAANPANGRSGSQIEIVIRSAADGSIAGEETVSSRLRPKQMGVLLAASLSKRPALPVEQAAQSPTEQGGGGLPPAPVPASVEAGKAAPPAEIDATSPLHRETSASGAKLAAADSDDASSVSRGGGGEGVSVVVTRGEGASFAGAVGKVSTFDLEADARTLRRTFEYEGGGGGRRYLLSFNPLASARASYYPIRNAGVFAAGEFGAGLETGSFPTGTRELMGGVLVRLPLSFGQVGASAAYFHHAFLVQDTTSPTDASRLTLAIPNTVYAGARLSVNARIALARRVEVVLDGAYRLVTTVGDRLGEVRSTAYFPGSASPYGVDGRAFVGVGLSSRFELRAGVDYRRYVYGGLQGTTTSGTAINATGAIDQYLAFSLGLAAVLGPK